jgi:hypothetical protein
MVKLFFLITMRIQEKKLRQVKSPAFVLVHLILQATCVHAAVWISTDATPTIISLNYYMYYFDKEPQLYWIWMDR